MKLWLWLLPICLCVSCALEAKYKTDPNYRDPTFTGPYFQRFYSPPSSDPFHDTRWTLATAVPVDKRASYGY
ncbi:MAG: hypothetical protein LBK71_01110 [Verrucomicrobiales bacterium]|jgi:hypothetical protein|nr:hypothetical protein [Verrucomicrobiales bacterium]